jgi:tetratricopeptide (TPR) repeat protein
VFETADKAMEYNSDNSGLYKYLASAYHQIKEYDKAIDTYNIAFAKADSTDFVELSEIIASMGDVYYSKGDTLACFAQYEKAIDYNPGNLMAMNNYAYFLAVNERDLDKAEKMSSTTVKYEPENPTFLDTYAWIFFKKGEYNLALTYMKAAIEHSEKQGEDPSAELYEHYGDALFMNGQHEQAVTYWEKALKLSPDSDLLQRKVKHKTFFFK